MSPIPGPSAGSRALLFGIAMIMLGNGLQGTLLGLRASIEGFATTTTGLVMTGYYVGFLAGSVVVPRLVRDVGHIRVFAALASLASAAVLLHHVFVDPWSWSVFRIATGFGYAGLYVVAESWLNERAGNETRGRLLATYMVISLGGLGAGQLLLNLADARAADLFILVSVLISLALVPISLTATRPPGFEAPRHVGLAGLYRVSPLGVAGCLCVGASYGAIFGMGAVYASAIGMPVSEVSYFMAIVLLGGIALQWPLGLLSDAVSRRAVISAVTAAAAAAALAAIVLAPISRGGLLAAVCAFGGLSLPLYSLCLAYTNDYLRADEMVAASATLVLVRGVGATTGPIGAAAAMAAVGPSGFLWFLASVHSALGLFALYRMTRRTAMPVSEQHHYPSIEAASPVAAAAIAREAARGVRERDAERADPR